MTAFLVKAWLFVRSPIGRYLLGAAAVLALLGVVWAAGDGHGHAGAEAINEVKAWRQWYAELSPGR
jgi:hypothetical protein